MEVVLHKEIKAERLILFYIQNFRLSKNITTKATTRLSSAKPGNMVTRNLFLGMKCFRNPSVYIRLVCILVQESWLKTQTYDKHETKTHESYVKANATNDSIIQKPELRRQ